MRRDSPRRRAAVSAFRLAFPLGILVMMGYAILLRRQSLFENLTLHENLTIVAVILGLWLLLWPLFVISQRRFDRADAMDPGPIELPPRDPAEMTGQELADWADGDPDRLRRLIWRARRLDGWGWDRPVRAGAGHDDISVRKYLRQLPWVAPGFLVVVLGMWAVGTPGTSLWWALFLWALLTLAIGPLVWLRSEVPANAPGLWRALGLAWLWCLGVCLLVGIVYGIVTAVLAA